jgi:transcription antitermination factor NusG
VLDGPFSSFNATVEEVDDTRSRLKVAVSILDDRRRLSSSLAKCKKSKTCCTDNFVLIDYHLTQRR